MSKRHGRGISEPRGCRATPARIRLPRASQSDWDSELWSRWDNTTPATLPLRRSAEGTEVSAKLYWNNYLINPATQYSTGSLLNLDFAITERIGRFQFGVAGFYAFQVADDKLFGVPIAPDGRRAEVLNIGPVLAYDMPEHAMSVKIKALTSVITANTVTTPGVVVSMFKKFH
jgi:hypothetical protein